MLLVLVCDHPNPKSQWWIILNKRTARFHDQKLLHNVRSRYRIIKMHRSKKHWILWINKTSLFSRYMYIESIYTQKQKDGIFMWWRILCHVHVHYGSRLWSRITLIIWGHQICPGNYVVKLLIKSVSSFQKRLWVSCYSK